MRWLPSITAVAVLFLVACQERLAAPAECPDLCPGGYVVRDTVLFPLQDADSSYEGYVLPGQPISMRVSYQLPASEDRGLIRFTARPDSFTVADTARAYAIDSVKISIGLLYRDTAVKNLVIYLYRLPATLDSTFTFTDAENAFTPASVIDTFMVADTLRNGILARTFKGATLAQVDIPAADSGIFAMGVQIRAAQPTGIRIGAQGATTFQPLFTTYLHVLTGDTANTTRTLTEAPPFSRFVSQTTPVLDTTLLTVGGLPSVRSLLRFRFPSILKDSAQLVRATLELIPTAPIPGLSGDTAFVQARPLLADFGGKSPAGTDGFYIGTAPLLLNQTDTVRLEVRRALTLWQGSQPLPNGFMLQLFPEGVSFTRATFGSSRTAGFTPRLRVTYALKFPFERP